MEDVCKIKDDRDAGERLHADPRTWMATRPAARLPHPVRAGIPFSFRFLPFTVSLCHSRAVSVRDPSHSCRITLHLSTYRSEDAPPGL